MSNNHTSNDIAWLWRNQLLAQAAWYDLRGSEVRKTVTATLAEHFLAMQNLLKTDCFIEIGAHEATFSRRAKNMYPSAKIFAFEANPHVYSVYHEQLSAEAPDISYLHSAVSDHDGYADFIFSDIIENKDGVLLKESQTGRRHSLFPLKNAKKSTRKKVPSVTLDTFIAQKQLTDATFCLWIDTEGATGLVLEGAKSTLQRTTSIYLEVEEKEFWQGQWNADQIFTWLIQRGFIPIFRDFEWAFQYNIIWLNKKFYSVVQQENAMYIQRCIRHRIEKTHKNNI